MSTSKRGKGGYRKDIGIYVRSSTEHNYALVLNWRKARKEIVDWEYELKEFEFHKIKRGTRTYLPDFKVIYPDGHYEWHEVKGWLDPKSKTQLKRMAKYYPEEKIILIDQSVYADLARIFKKVLPGWE